MVIPLCSALDTVAGCLGSRDGIVRGTEGSFFYGSGHMQVHAVSQMGLGNFRNSQLTSEVMGTLAVSNDHRMIYTQPQPAGGLVATASQYAGFLRGLLAGRFRMSGVLGKEKRLHQPQDLRNGDRGAGA